MTTVERVRARGRGTFETLAERPAPAHVPLLEKLWKDHRQLSPEVLSYLAATAPERTMTAARDCLSAPIGSLPPAAIEALFAYVGNADRPFAVKAAAAELARADIDTVGALAAVAATWRDPAFVEPLFSVVRSQSNPNLYLAAAHALLCYDEPEIDARLEAAAKEVPALRTGWGAAHLGKLLREKPRVYRD